MNAQTVLGIVRHILTTSGGVLISRGYTDPAGVESIVGGLCTIIGIVWSIYNKKAKPTV